MAAPADHSPQQIPLVGRALPWRVHRRLQIGQVLAKELSRLERRKRTAQIVHEATNVKAARASFDCPSLVNDVLQHLLFGQAVLVAHVYFTTAAFHRVDRSMHVEAGRIYCLL